MERLFQSITQAVEEIAKDYHEEYEFKRYLQKRWDFLVKLGPAPGQRKRCPVPCGFTSRAAEVPAVDQPWSIKQLIIMNSDAFKAAGRSRSNTAWTGTTYHPAVLDDVPRGEKSLLAPVDVPDHAGRHLGDHRWPGTSRPTGAPAGTRGTVARGRVFHHPGQERFPEAWLWRAGSAPRHASLFLFVLCAGHAAFVNPGSTKQNLFAAMRGHISRRRNCSGRGR